MADMKGCGCITIIFILVMLMLAIHTFFEPVWDRLMEIISGGK